MRRDMGKVITERPRSSSGEPTAKYGKSIRWEGWDADYHEPKRLSGSQGRTYSWGPKDFTDVLGPLRGWLRKQVGRPWNKVYSEICDVLDKRKLTHKHVLDHLFQWVCRTPILWQDGTWREVGSSSWSYIPDFFVHPRTGLLLRNRRRAVPVVKKPVEVLKIDDASEYKKINGIWYLCKMQLLPKKDWVWDPRTGRLVRNTVLGKRQLGKKELKELRNKILE